MTKTKGDVGLISKKVTIEEGRLTNMTKRIVDASGADNFCEAETLRLTSEAIAETNNAKLEPLKSHVRMNNESAAWVHSYNMVISFLKKHKMEETLQTVMCEFPEDQRPKSRNDVKPKIIDRYFTDVFAVMKKLRAQTMQDQKRNHAINSTIKNR